MDSKILVSIICNTFNHERFIRDALDGFVTQKTTFAFEVCIHDDASTDETANIIREYECKYPNIIKPIYQLENQYSQGRSPVQINIDRANGKYLSFCEGDDYWIDQFKLQKQVDYMESHPDCSFCFTNGIVREGDILKEKVIPWKHGGVIRYEKSKQDYNMSDIELVGYIPTASFMFPKTIWDSIPNFSDRIFRGDGFWKMYFTSKGYAHYINEATCVYRFKVENSITTSWNEDKNKYARFLDSYIQMVIELDEYTNRVFHDDLLIRIHHLMINKYIATNQLCELVNGEFLATLHKNSPLFIMKYFFYLIKGILNSIVGER